MTIVETLVGLAATVTVLGALVKVFGWWRQRPGATFPYFRVLKDNKKAQDPKRWVQINTRPGTTTGPLYAGVVVELRGNRRTVTLDHPEVGNQVVNLSPAYTVKKKHYPDRDRDGWIPRLDTA